ncbi:MAG TPA: cell division protein FtsL [Actinomycetota bacterium]|nr:cell division protein FtsL [Actinomycetota bacterium]
MSARPAHVAREDDRRAQLKVVRRRARHLIKREKPRKVAPVFIAGTICAVAVVFGVLLEQVVLAQSAFKMERLKQRIAVEEAEREELMLEAAMLDSPARIERFAKDVLGMVPPERIEYVVADIRLGRMAPQAASRLLAQSIIPPAATERAAVSAAGTP